jgi:membrane protein implicated in regulation of membrane protease activity
MLNSLQDLGALNLTYVIVLGISFLFALVSLLGGEAGDSLDVDADFDTEIGLANISPFSLAMFGATFGMVGLVTRLMLNMAALPSILWASGVGLVLGGAAQMLFIYVLSPSKSSHFSLTTDAVNRPATVLISIPATGLGQITYDNVSGRVTLPARGVENRPIPAGTTVIIERIVGREAYVRVGDPSAGSSE